MKIVVLDGANANPGDLSWDVLDKFGDVTVIDSTGDAYLPSVIGDADIVLHDTTPMTGETIRACSSLKMIGKLATGYDNIDLKAAEEKGIRVYNTPGYSTEAVAQHAIALLLEAACTIRKKNSLAKKGLWIDGGMKYEDAPSMLLAGKSLGIIGYGNIGKKVAEIAKALGMKINIYSIDKEACLKSDVISLHCPATDNNYHMIDENVISQMKKGVVIINAARGSLIDEKALFEALRSGHVAYAGLDVLEDEPVSASNPLLSLENCCITPHAAWIPKETRQKIIDIAAYNIASFIEGKDENRII